MELPNFVDSVKAKLSNRKQPNKKWPVFCEKHISHKLLCVCVCVHMNVCVHACVQACVIIMLRSAEWKDEFNRQHRMQLSKGETTADFKHTAIWFILQQKLFQPTHNGLFSVALCPQRQYRLLGMGSPGCPPPLSHSSKALTINGSVFSLLAQSVWTIRDEEPRTATSTSTQLLSSDRMIHNNYNTNMCVKSLITSKTSNKTIGVNFCLVCMSLQHCGCHVIH